MNLDLLRDLVQHTVGLELFDTIRIRGTATETRIDAINKERQMTMEAKSLIAEPEFQGVFAMPSLGRLSAILNIPEYKENAKIELINADRNGETVATGLHFENEKGDFKNDYRFMSMEIINEKLKTVKFKGAKWDIEFEPTQQSIQRLKFQAAAHSEETVFQIRTEDDNLVVSFGDASTHAGSFTFQPGVTGKLKQTWSWPVVQVMSILNLPGDITMKIADVGAMMITVDSGIATYDYILPAQSK